MISARFCLAVAALCFPVIAKAQSVNEICNPILATGVQDTFNATGASSSFHRLQSAVCRKETDTFQKAQQSKSSLGLDVPGYFDLTYGGNTNASNYQQRYMQFCGATSVEDVGGNFSNVAISTANVSLAQVFERCVNSALASSGALTAWVRPSSNLTTLTVFVRKGGTASITGFAAQPAVLSCSGGLSEASSTKPVIVNSSASFVCARTQNKTPIILAGSTANDGSLFQSPVEVPGQDETVAELAKRVTSLEASVVPAGTVAHFNKNDCPSGWAAVPNTWDGRYVVSQVQPGTVGQTIGIALSAAENRVTGRHSHTTSSAFYGGNCSSNECSSWGNGPRRGPLQVPAESTTAPTGMTVADGTNAPYVILKACTKN